MKSRHRVLMTMVGAAAYALPKKEEPAMEPIDSKRARILDKPDLIAAIVVGIAILVINAALLIILF